MEIHSDPLTLSKYLSLLKCVRKVALTKIKRKNAQTWFHQCKENFCKGFMVVAEFSYNRKLKISAQEKELKYY